MSDLEKYFAENTGPMVHKWKHYIEIYDRHLARFRGGDVHIVEFGVDQGGSLRMWKQYFGPRCKVFGIDVNPLCKQLEEDQIEIFIGDQEDRQFLRSLVKKLPRIDVLIDDGGHTMAQQINTFDECFAHIDGHGVYVCEDLHTSYWAEWGGGYKKPGTFIEYSKTFIDRINAWHSSRLSGLRITDFTRTVHSLHYYDSVLVIEKRPIQQPARVKTGTQAIPEALPPRTLFNRLKGRLKRELDRVVKPSMYERRKSP
jgi:23S rRNA U2552 (ribose-2'-O)-methylase RlmE/FtsJ